MNENCSQLHDRVIVQDFSQLYGRANERGTASIIINSVSALGKSMLGNRLKRALVAVIFAVGAAILPIHNAQAWFGALGVNGDVDFNDATNTRLCQISFFADGSTSAWGQWTLSGALGGNFIGGQQLVIGANAIRTAVSASDLEQCGLSNVTNLTQTFAPSGATLYDNMTEITLTFNAVHDAGATIDVSKAPRFTGDGTSVHAYVMQISGATTAAPTLTVTRTLIPSGSNSSALISNFLKERGNLILSNQPSLIEFVDGTRESANFNNFELGITAYQQAGRFSLSKRELENKDSALVADNPTAQAYKANAAQKEDRTGKWDAWAEVKAARSDIAQRDTSALLGFAGGHYFINENFIVGLMGQVDWAKQTDSSAGSTVKGTGWMFGPYLAGQVPEQDLYYEARAAWGTSSNKIAPNGTTEDKFNTTRWLISGKVSGAYEYGDYTIRPALFVSYIEERQEAYTDSDSSAIDAQTVSLGEFNLGPDVTREFTMENGMPLNAKLGVSAVYNFGVTGNSTTTSFQNGQLRARLNGELTTVLDSGASLSVNGYYDGLGQSSFQAYGGGFKLTVPIQ